MEILKIIKGWWQRMFKQEIADEFKVSGIESKEMSKAIELWLKIYQGNAPWVNPNANIDTIKFAKFICSEIARLVALDIDVSFDGKRKEYMQQFLMMQSSQDFVSGLNTDVQQEQLLSSQMQRVLTL